MGTLWTRALLLPVAFISTTLGADEPFEVSTERRLREVLGDKTFERDTTYGGRLKFIDSSDRMDAREVQYRLFYQLGARATREAVRVLAAYLSDERHTYSPGDDYGSPALCEDAASELFFIQRTHPEITPNAPKTSAVAPWRVWWHANKASYEQKTK